MTFAAGRASENVGHISQVLHSDRLTTHDIGYVRGIIKGDEDGNYIVDESGRKISLPRGASDAALAPYHVERSKPLVLDRLDKAGAICGRLGASCDMPPAETGNCAILEHEAREPAPADISANPSKKWVIRH
jgi:hypothetical protein